MKNIQKALLQTTAAARKKSMNAKKLTRGKQPLFKLPVNKKLNVYKTHTHPWHPSLPPGPSSSERDDDDDDVTGSRHEPRVDAGKQQPFHSIQPFLGSLRVVRLCVEQCCVTSFFFAANLRSENRLGRAPQGEVSLHRKWHLKALVRCPGVEPIVAQFTLPHTPV